MKKNALIGGLFDGLTIEISKRPTYLWVKRTSEGVLVYGAVRREGRIPYRRVKGGFEFCGYTHGLCSMCAQCQPRDDDHRESCKFCGSKLAII